MPRLAVIVTVFAALCCALSVLAGCGAAQQDPQTSAPVSPQVATALQVTKDTAPFAQPPGSMLPALPAGRSARGLTETSRDGVDSFERSASALPADPVLQLNSAASGISWGIWELPAVDELRYLDVKLSLPAGQQAWLALADYSAQRWDLFGPVVSGRVLDLDPARHSSPGGQLYAAVVAYDGAAVTVQSLSLIAFHSNAAPSAALQSDLSSGTAPLTVSFDASASSDPDSNITRYHWDFDGDGIFDGSSSTPQVQHVYSEGGSFNALVTAEDSDGEQGASAALGITVNNPPLALLEILESDVAKNEAISLQGADSSDPDGSIVLYEWDADGNGSFETSSGSQKNVGAFAARAGRLTLKLRVTDDDGAVDVAVAQLYVRGVNTFVADDRPFSGIHTQILGVNGRPAICFEGDAESSLWYVRASDSEGSSWPEPIEVDSSTNSGQDSSILLVNGRPAICHYDQSLGALKYIRASDSDGSAWPAQPKILEQGMPDQTTGSGCSMAIVAGQPAIAYHNHFGENHYIRALDASGDSWPGSYVVLDNGPGDTGWYNSLAVINGNPAVAYIDFGNGNLMFRRSADTLGASWPDERILDGDGKLPSLAEVDGRPAIAFKHGSNQELAYISCNSPSGEGGWNPVQILDTSGDAGEFAQLQVIGGLPAVCYCEDDLGQLRFIRATRADGTQWGSFEVIDGDGPNDLGRYCDMTLLNGNIFFSYTGVVNGNEDIVSCAVRY